MTIHLQGIGGVVNAIEASSLKPGDIVTWNYGYQSKVVSIEMSKTGKSVTAMMKSMRDGVIRERKMRAKTLVAVG